MKNAFFFFIIKEKWTLASYWKAAVQAGREYSVKRVERLCTLRQEECMRVLVRNRKKKRRQRGMETLRCPISAPSKSACATSAADIKGQTELTRSERLRRTHCSSSRRSCLRSRSGCHTSSGPECSCYSRSGIHEVRRSFHLFSSGANKQTARWKWLQRAWILIGKVELSDFSTRNQRFLGVSPSNSDSEFKTPRALWRPTHHQIKYLAALPIFLKKFCGEAELFRDKKQSPRKDKKILCCDENKSLAAVLDFWSTPFKILISLNTNRLTLTMIQLSSSLQLFYH